MINCPICKTDNVLLNVSTVENIWPDGRQVAYCAECFLYFLQEIPSKEEISSYYKNEYHNYSLLASLVKRTFRNFRCSSQFQYVIDSLGNVTNKHILEVGAGDGHLLSYFKDQNAVTGLEFSEKFVEYARKRYHITLIDRDFFEMSGKVDMILMSHVFEHFADIHAVLEKSMELLNEGGYMFIEVPNSPPHGGCSASDLKEYLATAHIYNFAVPNLEKLFTNHGYTIVAMNRFTYNLPEYYSELKKFKIAKSLLTGSGVELRNVGAIARYILKSMIAPKYSYSKIELTQSYAGLGDNIRIILKK